MLCEETESFLRRRLKMSFLKIKRVHLFHIFESLDETLLIHGTGLTPGCNKKYLHKKIITDVSLVICKDFVPVSCSIIQHSLLPLAVEIIQLKFLQNLKICTKPQVSEISFVNIVFVTHQRSKFYSFFHTYIRTYPSILF